MGADFEESQRYRKTLAKKSSRATRAIHAGMWVLKREDREILADAQDLCRRGTLKRLDEREKPNWDALILGSEDGGCDGERSE